MAAAPVSRWRVRVKNSIASPCVIIGGNTAVN